MNKYEGEIPTEETREEKADGYYQEIESMADSVGAMRKFLIENPRPDEQEFKKELVDNKQVSWPDRVKEKLISAFADYQEKSKAVDYHKENYEKNLDQFFEKMFGFTPRGRVGAIWHPLGVQLFLAKSDYEGVIRGVMESHTQRPLHDEGGFYEENLGSGKMKGLISISRKGISAGKAEKIFDHELQHTIHHNFFASNRDILKEFYRDLKRQTVKNHLEAKSYLETFRNILGERWRDEVLAYYISHHKIPSADECLGIDSDRLIFEIQEELFQEYLKDFDPKYSRLIFDPKFRRDLMEAVSSNNLENFTQYLVEAAEDHKVRIPTDDDAQELFDNIVEWNTKYFKPFLSSLAEVNENFFKDIKNKKEPLIKKLVDYFDEEKAFNLISVTHFSKLHHLEKLLARKQVPPEEEIE